MIKIIQIILYQAPESILRHYFIKVNKNIYSINIKYYIDKLKI